MQTAMQRPERLVVGHPFNPPHLIPLVEVVAGDQTGEKAVLDAINFYTAIGKKPLQVKQERLARFMEKQAEISTARLEAKVGTVQTCLVDVVDGELAIARTAGDAPEIDGVVQIQDGRDAGLQPGDFVDVAIMGSDEHDLYGEVDEVLG